ncbi:MAG TPA: hypothetical protein VN886_16110 [Acidimicrobiales bacterium]|nr:hypothetical protein [Acidimicrobiales bacterium]
MNLSDVADLPTVLDAKTTAEAFGCSLAHWYVMVREGRCPVEPVRVGTRRMVWPTARVLAVLGLSTTDTTDTDDNVVPFREGA